MSGSFYRAFEDRFRGGEELIRSCLGVYLPFLTPLLSLYSPASVLDIGCGRGEWLELMQDSGFEVLGVDLDDGMLRDCYDKKLPVEKGDAVDYLTKLPAESHAAVSAFHVVEHLPFEQLRILVAESLRVLKPGGLLIIETPNPENVVVATNNFYIDPTHQRPVPHQLLSFITEHVGFERVKTLRLQESPEMFSKDSITLSDVLCGASPDYAIVAQKKAEPEQMEPFDEAFLKHHGISMIELAVNYDRQLKWFEERTELNATIAAQKGDVIRLEKSLESQRKEQLAWFKERDGLNETLSSQKGEISRLETVVAVANEKIAELSHSSHHWFVTAGHFEHELNSVYSSKSWRIAWPLRKGSQLIKVLLSAPSKGVPKTKDALRRVFRVILIELFSCVQRHPGIADKGRRFLDRHPQLKKRVRQEMMEPPQNNAVATASQESSLELANLTPRGREIYFALKKQLGIQKGKGA